MPRGAQELDESLIFVAYGAITLFDGTFQNPSAKDQIGNSHMSVLQPPSTLRLMGLGFSSFARHY